MNLETKKLKVDMSATLRKNSVTGHYYSFPKLMERTKETFFEMYYLKSTFLKHWRKNALFVKRFFWAKNVLATIRILQDFGGKKILPFY